jgi:signal recognition particle GTPase
MSQITRLGSFGKILSFLPGMGQLSKMMGSMDIDPDRQIRKIGGIIDSMTAEERKNPGSSTSVGGGVSPTGRGSPQTKFPNC